MAANRQTQTGSNPAITFGGDLPSGSFNLQKLDAAKYVSLYDLVNKPDNRDALIKTYGASSSHSASSATPCCGTSC